MLKFAVLSLALILSPLCYAGTGITIALKEIHHNSDGWQKVSTAFLKITNSDERQGFLSNSYAVPRGEYIHASNAFRSLEDFDVFVGTDQLLPFTKQNPSSLVTQIFLIRKSESGFFEKGHKLPDLILGKKADFASFELCNHFEGYKDSACIDIDQLGSTPIQRTIHFESLWAVLEISTNGKTSN